MTHCTDETRRPPFPRRSGLALLAAAILAASLAEPALAEEPREEIRIAVADVGRMDAHGLARVRRQIAAAASAVCFSGGLSAIYRSGDRRCRERVIAEAERQLQSRLAPRLAASSR